MRITHAAKTGLIGLAAGAALTMGATVPAAQAAPAPATAVMPVTAQPASAASAPRWFNLGHYSGKPRGIWYLPSKFGGVRSKAKVFQVAARCWGGSDGTRMSGTIWERKSGGFYKSVKSFRKVPCNGKMQYSRISNAKIGNQYRVSIQLSGKRHTIEAWLQNYG
ncbi:hypothetical protein [Nonomuraea sp. NPDC002799]